MTRPVLRLALMTLPLLLGISSLAALVLAPFAWGAGNHAGLPAWMPTASALAFGLPGAVIAGVCLRQLSNKMVGAFGLAPLLLCFGLLTMPLTIAAETAVAVGVANPATYDRLTSGSGAADEAASLAGASTDEVSPSGFLVGTLVMSLLLNGLVAASATSYIAAITVEKGGRYDRRPGEVDGVGELLSGRPSAHEPARRSP